MRLQSLLSDPNPSSPANQEAARLYAENRREYNRRVQQCATESLKTVGAPDADASGAASSAAADIPSGAPNSASADPAAAPDGSGMAEGGAPEAVQQQQTESGEAQPRGEEGQGGGAAP